MPLSPPSCRGVPALPRGVVRRGRLEARLGDGERRPVTLVSGLPGAGKTTLVASWLRASERPAAWLDLDERHDAPGRLGRAVARGLAAIGATSEPARLRRSDPAVVDRAFDALRPGRWVLVLDDVQELRSAAALAALRLVVDRAPPGLSIVLCTRADPPIARGRMRLSGRLGEIRNADLEFTPAEAAQLVAAHGVEMRPDEVRSLWRRTQGWAAGLRLAAGTLQAGGDRRHLVRSAAATEAAVADYLLEEVLDRQDAATQGFLLRTSVAERLTPDLAAALTGDPRADERLDDLQRSGIFVPDATDGWYRYHALVADLLRSSLRRRHPDLVAGLHDRAASWLLAEGLAADAEHHARRAGNWPLVGRLATDRWLGAVLDDAEPAPDLLAGAPPDAVAATADLSLVAAGLACGRADRDAADLHAGRYDDLAPARGPGHEPRARRVLDLVHGWAFGAGERARRAARDLGATAGGDHATAAALRRLARLRGAEFDVDAGRFDAAVTALCALADGRDGDWMGIEASAVLALVHAANGDLDDADRRLARVLAGEDAPDLHPPAAVAAHVASALCHALRGERRSAADHLARADAAGEVASRPLRSVRRALRSVLGGPERSAAWLDSATAAHPLAGQALVACGVLEVVSPEHRLVAVGGPAERAVARARQDLARHAPGAGRAALGGVLRAETPVHPRTAVEARVLAAVAATGSGDDDEAREHLGAALGLVVTSGVRAPLLDRVDDLAGLLDTAAVPGPGTVLVLELLDHRRHAPPGVAAPVELLTARETAVLQHLPTLMSNAEIAQGLNVSINTVKSHLKSVYRKLGVQGRRDAVLRGRELELF